MKLTSKLALSQLKSNRARSIWTLVGIVLSVGAICAIFGFVATGNQLLIDYTGEDSTTRGLYQAALASITTLLCFVVVAASVTVISNAFRVSAAQRTVQFGILKSVGATKQQIIQMMLSEALWLCAVGVPVGVALGVLVHFIGIEIANYLIGISVVESNLLVLRFVLTWQPLVGSAALALATVLFSAWFPARKAAKIPAIDAIRAAGEVSEKIKRARPGRVLKRLFGMEGELAHRSIKRNRRNLRATVISLTISIILFITGSSIGLQMGKVTSMILPNVEADIVVEFNSNTISVGAERMNRAADANNTSSNDWAVLYNQLDLAVADEFTACLRAYVGAEVYAAGTDVFSYTTNFAGMLTPEMQDFFGEGYQPYLTVVTLDAEHYAKLCESSGVPVGSNLLVNYFSYMDEKRKSHELTPLTFTGQTLELTDSSGDAYQLPLHGELTGNEVSEELRYILGGNFAVIVPAGEANAGADADAGAAGAGAALPLSMSNYQWIVKTNDPSGFSAYAKGFADDLLVSGITKTVQGNEQLIEEWEITQEENAAAGLATVSDVLREYSISVTDLAVELERTRNVTRLIMLPVIAFVSTLGLIALTNIISTISTNMRARAREFAMLMSVGMSKKSISRMLSLESVVCSLRALIIGLPLGAVLAYFVYLAVNQSAGYDYDIPWLVFVFCILGVLVVMLITTWFTARRLRKSSIVETIRTNDGM